MTWMRKLIGARWSRPVWGVLAVVTGALLALSFLLSGRSLRSAEADAQNKAEEYTNIVLANSLTPEEVQGPILKADYRNLIIAVQQSILTDPAVARLRIWQPDGTLIFSSDQRDSIGQALGAGNPQIEAAVQGETQTVLTEARVAAKTGLAGSDESLYETFVPLRLGGSVAVGAISQIDQRYSSITSQAYRFWRPAEWALGGSCAVFLLLFWASLLAKPVPARVAAVAGPGGTAEQVGATDARVRQLEQRLVAREREFQEAVSAKVALERRSREAMRAAAPDAARLVEELKRSEAERERVAGEVQRLSAALAAKEADLALAKANVATGDAATAKADEAIRAAEGRVSGAEGRAREAEQRAIEAEAGLREAEARVREAETALASLEAAVSSSKEAGEKRAAADLKKAEQEAEKAALQVAETETRAAEQRARIDSLETAAKTADERAATLESRVREIEDERRRGVEEIARAEERLGNTQWELTGATGRVRELEQRVRELEGAGAAMRERPAPEKGSEAATSPLARLRREAQKAARGSTEEATPDIGEHEPAAGEPAPVDEAGLSLRERLARAAAARHRVPGSGESES